MEQLDQLPMESESAEIGHRALQAFTAQRPTSWRPQDTSGDADVGVDSWIQVVHNERYAETFLAQFKGSTSSAYSADRSFVSVSLKVSTINYYRRLGIPLMLVFADFSADERPSDCPIYYQWIHDKLDEVLAGAEPSAKSVTFRIPTANRLHDKLDVVPYLSAERDIRLKLNTLSQAIVGVAPPEAAPTTVSQLATNLKSRGAAYLESTLGTSDTPWADPMPGTMAWSLKQLNDRIGIGAVGEARTLLERIDRAHLRDVQERAELEYLSGTLARSTGDLATAEHGFREARNLVPANPRYLTAWMEFRLLRSFEDRQFVADLLHELDTGENTDHPKIRGLRARLLTVLERYNEADQELNAIPAEYAAVERVVMLLTQDRLDSAIAVAHESQSLDVGRNTLLTLRILGARARFERAFAIEKGIAAPLTGPPGLNPQELIELWNELRNLSRDLSAAGWPANSEYVFDIFAATAAAVNQPGEALPLLDSFLEAKPFRDELQPVRMRLAVLAEKFELALDAASKIDDDRVRTVNEVLVHYHAKKFPKVLALVERLLEVPFNVDLLPDALAVSAHSARRMFDRQVEDACLSRLKEGGFLDRIAVYRFVSAFSGDKAARATAKQELVEAFNNYPESSLIQVHLLAQALDPNEDEDARLILRVADAVQSKRQLLAEEIIAKAHALTTLGDFDHALREMDAARTKFQNDPILMASEALICERAGYVPRARALLHDVIDSSEFARSIYINIAARSGLLEEAATQLEAMLAASETRTRRKEAMRSLISVEIHRGGKSPRLRQLVREFGNLVDQNSEEEEGIFLQTALIAGIRIGERPSEHEQIEMQRRVHAYIERFPNSRYFGSIQIPEEGGAEALQKAIAKKFGTSVSEAAGLARLRQLASRGEAAVPYSWRPSVLVSAARTVAQLWELTKRIGGESALLSFSVDRAVAPLKDLRLERCIPILDTLSLLIITDLRIWDLLFKVFDRVAISKETLLRIQQDDGPLSEPSESLADLRGAIRKYIDRIEQPGEVKEGTLAGRDATLGEIKRLMPHGRYVFFSDDVASRIYVLGDEEAKRGVTTVQLVRHAEQVGLIGAAEAAKKLAQMVRWHVGFISVDDRHILACLPLEATEVRGLAEKIQALHGDADYQALISGLWDLPKPLGETLHHVVRLLGLLLRYNADVDDRVVAAIWASWLDKISVRPDVEVGVDEHLAMVLILVCHSLGDSEAGIRKMWRAYIALTERRHGRYMDEERENDARRAVGRTIARFANANDEFRDRANDLLMAVQRGLTAGTAEYDYVTEGYEQKRAETFQSRT